MNDESQEIIVPAYTTPITGPEDIQTHEIRVAVEALVLAQEERPALALSSPYTLSVKPKDEDPRGKLRRGWDATIAYFLPESKGIQRARQREQLRQIAHAQALYGWAEENKEGVVAALGQLRTAHQRIGAYITQTEAGIRGLEEAIESVEARAGETREHIKRLDKEINSPEYIADLERKIGLSGASATIERYRAERDACRTEVAQIPRQRAYVDLLTHEFSEDTAASRQSLFLIDQAIKETTPLRLRLERTLGRYRGLTAPEIDAAQAIQFLAEIRAVVGELNEGTRAVHYDLMAQAEAFVETSEQPYAPVLTEIELLALPPKKEEQ